MKISTKKYPLFQRVHRNLTILFTAITSLILISMSVGHLYISEKELKDNGYLSFLNESNTIFSNMEHQTTITGSWLSTLSANNHFLMAVYDNDNMLSHTEKTLTNDQKQMVTDVLAEGKKILPPSLSSSTAYTSDRADFYYSDDDGTTYYTNIARIKNSSAYLYMVILSSTRPLERQLYRQRFFFFLINLAGILLLFLFSHFYTKKLLLPIQENQEKQTGFIATASHEFRTPLAVMHSCLDAFRQANPEVKEQFLQTMEKENRRLSSLVNDMLILTQTSGRSLSVNMSETELDTLLLNSYEEFLPLAKEKGLRLFIELPEQIIPACLCDAGRLSQVLGILISNAVSYCNKNGYIKLALSTSHSRFFLTVEDNGIGISDTAKPHIFERFYREDSSRNKQEHFGLGLCIAKEIIDFHHGHITVSDTPGGGTTFTISLPIRKQI